MTKSESRIPSLDEMYELAVTDNLAGHEAEMVNFVRAVSIFLQEYQVEPRLALSDLYLTATAGDPSYEGYDEDLDAFEYEGVEAPGFWSKAWKVVRGDHTEVEDAFQDVVVGAIETVLEHPEITEEGAGYLLQRAMWKAQNKRNKERQTYLRKTHNIQTVSIDKEHGHDEATDAKQGEKMANYHEALAAPTVDHDMRLAVQQVVGQIEDERMAQVAELLMEGLSKSAVAEHLGVTPAAITYQVKKLEMFFGEHGLSI
jgi:hypothetical protein